MKILLVLGHQANRESDHGARGIESDLALLYLQECRNRLAHLGHDVNVAAEPRGYRYWRRHANLNRYDYWGECHYNAGGGGMATEVLCAKGSTVGSRVAAEVAERISSALGTKLRHGNGVLPRRLNQRGGRNLLLTRMPANIFEPFFIDDDEAAGVARSHCGEIGRAVADGIDAGLGTGSG